MEEGEDACSCLAHGGEGERTEGRTQERVSRDGVSTEVPSPCARDMMLNHGTVRGCIVLGIRLKSISRMCLYDLL